MDGELSCIAEGKPKRRFGLNVKCSRAHLPQCCSYLHRLRFDGDGWASTNRPVDGSTTVWLQRRRCALFETRRVKALTYSSEYPSDSLHPPIPRDFPDGRVSYPGCRQLLRLALSYAGTRQRRFKMSLAADSVVSGRPWKNDMPIWPR